MNLPENKNPKRIVYEYSNGEQYYISGQALQSYLDNVKAASIFFVLHSNKFNDVKWKKVKTKEKQIDDTILIKAYNNKIHAIRKKDDKFIISDTAKNKIQARLKDFTETELLEAIDNFANAEWWMKNNSHRGIKWFMHTQDRIEQFINLSENTKEDPAITRLRKVIGETNGN